MNLRASLAFVLLGASIAAPVACSTTVTPSDRATQTSASSSTSSQMFGDTSQDECVVCSDPTPHCWHPTGARVACLSDTDCSTWKSGTKCLDDHSCGCASAADCSGDTFGPACAPVTHQCGCGSDADCTEKGFPYCAPSIGQCDECLTNADCKAPDLAACNDGFCVPCNVDADCAASSYGRTCLSAQNLCGCHFDSECTTSPRGPHCILSDGVFGQCNCEIDADCSKSPDGLRCFDHSCGCSVDADCPQGDFCGEGSCQPK